MITTIYTSIKELKGTRSLWHNVIVPYVIYFSGVVRAKSLIVTKLGKIKNCVLRALCMISKCIQSAGFLLACECIDDFLIPFQRAEAKTILSSREYLLKQPWERHNCISIRHWLIQASDYRIYAGLTHD